MGQIFNRRGGSMFTPALTVFLRQKSRRLSLGDKITSSQRKVFPTYETPQARAWITAH